MCNSIGQCHCDEGFGPPFCNEPGYGGSLHSGPVKIKGIHMIESFIGIEKSNLNIEMIYFH